MAACRSIPLPMPLHRSKVESLLPLPPNPIYSSVQERRSSLSGFRAQRSNEFRDQICRDSPTVLRSGSNVIDRLYLFGNSPSSLFNKLETYLSAKQRLLCLSQTHRNRGDTPHANSYLFDHPICNSGQTGNAYL